MTNHKAIDISKLNKKTLQKITYADLVSDAAARQDKDAYAILCRINQENESKPPHSRQRIQTIRNEYLHTFCGYGKPTPQPRPQSVHEQQQLLLESVAHLFE